MLLLRKFSIKKNSRFMIYFVNFNICWYRISILFRIFGFELIKFIYMRGEFNYEDVKQTTYFIQDLSYFLF